MTYGTLAYLKPGDIILTMRHNCEQGMIVDQFMVSG